MYPVCLDIAGRLCVVIGGGSVAERKVSGLVGESASIRIVSPELTSALAGLARQGRCEWRRKCYERQDIEDAFLVFAATSDSHVQKRIARDAEGLGILVNVIDRPDLCSFQVPATLRREDLVIAVSTQGKSPRLAAQIRQELEEMYGPEYGTLVRLLGMVRPLVLEAAGDCSVRKTMFRDILHRRMIDWIRQGQTEKILSHLRNVVGHDIDVDLKKLDPDS